MEFKEDLGTGYMYCYNPDHYCANGAGKVMEHVYVMSEQIGRKLGPEECVHHRDRNRKNNDPDNLRLITRSEHMRLHQMEDSGAVFTDNKCEICENVFVTSQRCPRKYCSSSCSIKGKERFSISCDDLEILVWSKPTIQVAVDLGVSDVAVAKRCKKLGIEKPPRGYWAKKAYGYID